MILIEKNLKFTFDSASNSEASKYDEWAFYRSRFVKVVNGTKAVDFIYIDKPSNNTWLIEVKDYRHPDTEKNKPSVLANTVAAKVKDTLAGLVAAERNASAEEKDFAKNALKSSRIRVVLHVEQSKNRLFTIDVADLQTKLKQQVKAIDAHPCVVGQKSLKANMNWTVKG